MEEELRQAKAYAEEKLGFEVPEDDYQHILEYTVRKLDYVKKGMDYLPLLLETEITDFYMRQYINTRTMVLMNAKASTEMLAVNN
jgi:hypothetical protein